MATIIKCDVCREREAVGKVTVNISAENAVRHGTQTGVAYDMDACGDCRSEAMRQLFDKSLMQLEHDTPLHVVMHAARDEENEAAAEIAKLIKEGESPTALHILELKKRVDAAALRYEEASKGVA